MPEIILKRIKTLKKNYKFLVFFGITFIVGVVLGIITFKRGAGNEFFYETVFNYFYNIFSPSVNPLHVFFKRIFIDLGYIAVFFLLGLSIYAFPIEYIIVFYRGMVIGCVSCIFFSCYSFYGLFLFIAVTLPQNLIVFAGLACLGVLNFDVGMNKTCKKAVFMDYLINAAFGYVICIFGAIYEMALLLLIIRPLNFYL